MSDKLKEIKNVNKVKFTGTFSKIPEFHHESYGERYYSIEFKVKRISGVIDSIPIIVSDHIIDIDSFSKLINKLIYIEGSYRSVRLTDDSEKGYHYEYFVFCNTLELATTENENSKDDCINDVTFKGTVFGDPRLRNTGKDKDIRICDIRVSMKRGSYNHRDIAPCCVWERNAIFASKLEPGDIVEINGRLQSRQIIIKDENGNIVKTKTKCELSASSISLIQKKEKEDEPVETNNINE